MGATGRREERKASYENSTSAALIPSAQMGRRGRRARGWQIRRNRRSRKTAPLQKGSTAGYYGRQSGVPHCTRRPVHHPTEGDSVRQKNRQGKPSFYTRITVVRTKRALTRGPHLTIIKKGVGEHARARPDLAHAKSVRETSRAASRIRPANRIHEFRIGFYMMPRSARVQAPPDLAVLPTRLFAKENRPQHLSGPRALATKKPRRTTTNGPTESFGFRCNGQLAGAF